MKIVKIWYLISTIHTISLPNVITSETIDKIESFNFLLGYENGKVVKMRSDSIDDITEVYARFDARPITALARYKSSDGEYIHIHTW